MVRAGKTTSIHGCKVCAVVVGVTLLSASASAQSELEALQRCKAMQDDAARLACYDALNNPAPPRVETPAPPRAEKPAVLPQEAPPPPVAQPPAAAAKTVTPQALDDEVGRERLKSKDDDELMVRGHVVRCREDITSKYRFYFENGQIWQQKDNKTIPWEECDFEVTISKDFFGYKMQPDGEKKKIRIARIK